jgi:hypothetical protein
VPRKSSRLGRLAGSVVEYVSIAKKAKIKKREIEFKKDTILLDTNITPSKKVSSIVLG